MDVDHVVPVAAGGSNHRSNLRFACASCNRGRGHADIPDISEFFMRTLRGETVTLRSQQPVMEKTQFGYRPTTVRETITLTQLMYDSSEWATLQRIHATGHSDGHRAGYALSRGAIATALGVTEEQLLDFTLDQALQFLTPATDAELEAVR
jgi:hypothetical protein